MNEGSRHRPVTIDAHSALERMSAQQRGRAVAGISAAVGVVVVMGATRHGPGLSPDSINYFAGAASLYRGNGINGFDGEPVTVFPPGVSLLLAAGRAVGADLELAARLISCASVIAIVFLTYFLLRRHVHSTSLVALGTLLAAVAPAMLRIEQMAWSEPPFVALVLAVIAAFDVAIHMDSQRWLVVAGIAAGASFVFRYAGVVPLAAGALMALLSGRAGARESLRRLLLFAAGAVWLPLTVVARNWWNDRKFLGPRSTRSAETLIGVMKRFTAVMGDWLLPHPVPVGLQRLAGGLVIIVIALGFGVAVVKWVLRRGETAGVDPLLLLMVMPVAHALYMTAAVLYTGIDPLDNRLLSPMFCPLLIAATIAIGGLCERWSSIARALVIAAAVFVAIHGFATLREARQSFTSGQGYQTTEWREIPVARAAAFLPRHATLISNRPDVVWLRGNHREVSYSPARSPGRAVSDAAFPRSFAADAACRDTYLVWFDTDEDHRFGLDEMREHVTLTLVAESAHSGIYSVTSSQTCRR